MPRSLTRYQYAQIVKTADGKKFIDAPVPPSKAKILAGASSFLAGTGDTLFSIAYKQYKAMLNRKTDIRPSSFYYAIAYANDILDIHAPLTEGSTIKIPTLSNLRNVILKAPSSYTGNEIDLSTPQ